MNTRWHNDEIPIWHRSYANWNLFIFLDISEAAVMFHEEVADFKYAIRSALSSFFLMPANIIFVPGMYFLGFSKYSIRVLSLQTIPGK